ncbi:hypothetical protein J2S74_000152 [Evansella vedderi]|uniref:Uncharacterized protein n=1 Tax=Evansella vedderi TaxID=38282 RepID=A0ABT9ZNH0_9BACI|nr:hypothetical protein [Evansella vedderi]MDQ0252780.1 hypothetical protein [Evansella vedderi]
MNEEQRSQLNEIRSMAEDLTKRQIEYWQTYSDFGSWEFWVVVLMLIVPLIVLFIFMDKSRALLLGFFGLNYHVWFHYTNAIGISLGLWEYPYSLLSFLPSFALDAALVPVCFMLLYQWTLNRGKNIYLWAVILSAFFAFIMKPVMVWLHLFHMHYWVNYFGLFVFYVLFFLVSKGVASLFLWLQHKGT